MPHLLCEGASRHRRAHGARTPLARLLVARRLLERTGEFTAEAPTSATGHFEFFAGEGDRTLCTLAPKAEPVDMTVHAAVVSVADVAVAI